MQLKNRELWEESCRNNENAKIDTYGGCVNFAAQMWADMMEAAIANGATVESCAKDCFHETDKRLGRFGLTGFQYGCAVSILSAVWERGEELRRWHNLDTQVGSEGVRANESGGVLNPALLVVAG